MQADDAEQEGALSAQTCGCSMRGGGQKGGSERFGASYKPVFLYVLGLGWWYNIPLAYLSDYLPIV